MHFTVTVAIPGDVPKESLQSELSRIMDRYDESREVPLHRDTSIYAETFEESLAKMKEYSEKKGSDLSGLTDAEIVEQWNGETEFDADGHPLTTRNPEGNWDWYVIGGRWGGSWTLKEDASEADYIKNATEASAFGMADGASDPRAVDCARIRALSAESLSSPYSYIGLDGEWRTKWIGPSREEAQSDEPYGDTSHWSMDQNLWEADFLTFIADLPRDTWLINVDAHS